METNLKSERKLAEVGVYGITTAIRFVLSRIFVSRAF